MSWLARSIANSLKFDDDDDEEENTTTTTAATAGDNAADPVSESDQQPQSPSSTTPRGVKEDLTDLKKTLTRQLWGVASFLAPPPESPSADQNDSQTRAQVSDQDGSNDEDDDDALISGIRSDFAEIGGRFKSGISKLSSHKTVSEITKMASNLLQFGSESGDGEVVVGSVVGVTDEVVGFVRDIATHPETWLDFPVPDVEDFEDFDMSDAQQEHALAVERLAPRLAALRIELCPGYMSEGCFWKIYFVLLHPRLSKQDAELLSTPPIVEARRMLSYELHNKAKAKPTQVLSGIGSATLNETADLPHEESPSVPSRAESEALPLMASGVDDVPSNVAPESETEKHPVQSKEIQIIDKAVVEEETVKQTNYQHTSSSSSKVLDEKFEDDADDWLKEESSEMAGTSGVSMPIGNDEDVSFSDLEEDDGDEPTTDKKVTSGSDSSAKESRDWVQLSRSSTDSVKDINPVSVKRARSEQVSARNSETKESNDWLDVDDIEVM